MRPYWKIFIDNSRLLPRSITDGPRYRQPIVMPNNGGRHAIETADTLGGAPRGKAPQAASIASATSWAAGDRADGTLYTGPKSAA
jgi:hypothetical protein